VNEDVLPVTGDHIYPMTDRSAINS